MNSIKSGVKLYGTKPEMAIVHSVVCSVFAQHGYDCVVTSGIRNKLTRGSLHDVGFAEDYRSKHLSDKHIKHKILAELQDALPCCDILLEHLNQPQEHFHVEVDPKDDPNFQRDKSIYKKIGNWPD